MSESKDNVKSKTQKKRGLGIYMQNILTRKVQLPFNKVGSNLTENIITSLNFSTSNLPPA